MSNLVSFFGGLLIALILWFFSSQKEEFLERFPFWFRTTILRQRALRFREWPPQDPETIKRFRLDPLRIADLKFLIRVFIGGDGHTRYTYPDGIKCKWASDDLVLPIDMQQFKSKFVDLRQKEAETRGAVFVNRRHARIDDYEIGLHGLEESPWPLKLTISETDYFTIQATNASIDEILPGGRTIREKYATDPNEFKSSVLANPIAVNLSVVTADNKIYVSLRGRKTAVNPGGFAPAVSGTGDPLKDCEQNVGSNSLYNPFLTAQREASEEILAFKPQLQEITFFGLARTLRYQYPFLFGEVRLKGVTSKELESQFPVGEWESEGLVSMPLEVDHVITFTRDVYKEFDEKKILSTGTYAAIFMLLQSLHYEYPDDWEGIIRLLIKVQKRHRVYMRE